MPARPQLFAQILEALRENSTRAVLMHAAVAERLGLAPTDHKALDLLDRLGPMTAGELATQTGLTSGAITGVADRLEAAGHLRRVRDPQDRRKVILERSQQNDARLNVVFGALSGHTEALLGHYEDSELRIILDFLHRANEMTAPRNHPLDPA